MAANQDTSAPEYQIVAECADWTEIAAILTEAHAAYV